MFERFAKSVFTCVVDGRTGLLMIYGNDPNQSWPERDHSKVPLYRISKHHFCVLVGVISGLASDWWYVLCTWTWFVHTKDRYTLQISYDFTNHGNFSRDIQLCPFPSWQIGNDYSSCSVRVCRNTAPNGNCYSRCPSNCNNNQHIRLVLALERINKGRNVSPQRDKEFRAEILGCFRVLKQTFQINKSLSMQLPQIQSTKIISSRLSNMSQKVTHTQKTQCKRLIVAGKL